MADISDVLLAYRKPDGTPSSVTKVTLPTDDVSFEVPANLRRESDIKAACERSERYGGRRALQRVSIHGAWVVCQRGWSANGLTLAAYYNFPSTADGSRRVS